jgi:hypothetical protein
MRRALLTLTLLVAAPAQGAVFRQTSVEWLARGADAVVRARAERVESRLAPDGLRIFTEVTLRTLQVWRGTAPALLVVTVPGGELGGWGQRVDGAPVFKAGEEVVVFLARRGGMAAWSVHGLALGRFLVEGGTARPVLDGARVVAGAVPHGERVVEAMPVAELEQRVRGAP